MVKQAFLVILFAVVLLGSSAVAVMFSLYGLVLFLWLGATVLAAGTGNIDTSYNARFPQTKGPEEDQDNG